MVNNVFFSSDHHFSHVNIIDFSDRPFSSVEEMNEMFIQYWNETVDCDDKVFYLGDFGLGRIEATLTIVQRLNGIKYLLPGNHDRCWRGHAENKWRRWEPLYREAGFRIIVPKFPSYIEKNLGGVDFTLCHFPFYGNSRDLPGRADRYSGHRPPDRGQWLIHGHTHAESVKEGRMIHIGVDAWDYRPVPLEWVLELIGKE